MAMEKTMIRNIAVVSLSRGMIGEPDVQFEVEIGIRRLEEYGLHVKFMPHALKGLEYIKAHPYYSLRRQCGRGCGKAKHSF